MITPVIIQVLFWIVVVGVVITGFAMMSQSFLQGLLIVVLGPIFVRINCELIMVLFAINNTLTDIKNQGQGSTDGDG